MSLENIMLGINFILLFIGLLISSVKISKLDKRITLESAITLLKPLHEEKKIERSLDITSIKTAKENISDIVVFGDGNLFKLLCKASSQNQGFMKTTKVMNLPDGALFQTETQQRNPDGTFSLSQAMQFVPGVNWYSVENSKEIYIDKIRS